MTSDADRLAYLAGDGGALPPEERAELDALRELLAEPSTWEEPPAGLEDAVVAAIAAEATALETRPDTAPETQPATTATAPPPARRRWRPAATIGVAAAALAVGVGAGVLLGRDDTDTWETSFALAGQDLAPDASGQAQARNDDAGVRIDLEVEGLPELPPGQFYQAWLRGDAGLVPIGTFSQSGSVTLWSGVPLEDFPTLSVTIESNDGDQASSGQRVLLGEVEPDD